MKSTTTTMRFMMPSRLRGGKQPQRGEIWIVNFNSPISAKTPPRGSLKPAWPATGDEIAKARPAVVLNVPNSWELDLSIVVPLRSWKDRFRDNNYYWIVYVQKNAMNKLTNHSGADAFQVKSVSNLRFRRRIGSVTPEQLQLITDTVAFCIGAAQMKSGRK